MRNKSAVRRARALALLLVVLLGAGAGYLCLNGRNEPEYFTRSVPTSTPRASVAADRWSVRLLGRQSPSGTLTLARTADAARPWTKALHLLTSAKDVRAGEPVKISIARGHLGRSGAVLKRRLDEPLPPGAAAALSFYDEHHGTWRTVRTRLSADRRTLTARVHHFSWWTWVEYGAGWLLDTRVDAPTCKGQPKPSWVDSTVFVDDKNSPLRWCVGRDERNPSLLEVKVTVNRSYGVAVHLLTKPTWQYSSLFGSGPESLISNLVARGVTAPGTAGTTFSGEIPLLGGETAAFGFSEEQVRAHPEIPLIRVSPDLKNALAGWTYKGLVEYGGFDRGDGKASKAFAATVAYIAIAQCMTSVAQPFGDRRYTDAAQAMFRCLEGAEDDIAIGAAKAWVARDAKKPESQRIDPKRAGRLAGKLVGRLFQITAFYRGATWLADRSLNKEAFQLRVFPVIQRGSAASSSTGSTPAQPPEPTPSSSDPPVCSTWLAMDAEAQDEAIRVMTASHDDGTSAGLSRFSVRAFCALFPGRTIDGVYSPGAPEPNASGSDMASGDPPVCRDWQQLNSDDADRALLSGARSRGDNSDISTLRLSAGLFCKLYPDRTIDGIYSG